VDLVVKQQKHISLDEQVAAQEELRTMTLLVEMQIAREIQSSYDIEPFLLAIHSIASFCSYCIHVSATLIFRSEAEAISACSRVKNPGLLILTYCNEAAPWRPSSLLALGIL
jgi:hypothetical protein